MSELYRRISVRMWGDADFRRLSAPQPNARDLWIYLLTGPHTTPIPGLFRATREGLAAELKWDQKSFLEVLSELLPEGFREGFPEGAAKEGREPSASDITPPRKAFFEADWDAGVVWIEKAIEHNEPQSPNVVKGWRKHLDLIPECSLKEKAFQTLKAFAEGKSKAFAKAFYEAFEKGKPKAIAKAKGISGTGTGTGTGGVTRARAREPNPTDNDRDPGEPEPSLADSVSLQQLVRIRFERMFDELTGHPPSWTRSNIDQTKALAAWLGPQGETAEAYERLLATTLGNFFADPRMRDAGFPIHFLANDAAKFLRPPRASPGRSGGGFTAPAAPEGFTGKEADLDALYGPLKTKGAANG